MVDDDDPARVAEAPVLPDEALVVRLGLSAPDTLRKTALAHFDDHGEFAISVVSLPHATVDELAHLAGLPHPRLRTTTVGAIRAVGFDVVPDEPPPGHALITLPRLPADEDYAAIADVFGPPEPNPALKEETNG
jgi:hypothetical protein